MDEDPQRLVNYARSALRARNLSSYDEGVLNEMLSALKMYQASGQEQMGSGVVEAVENELTKKQTERHHNHAITELNRIHKEQLEEAQRLNSESARDSDKKHSQTSATAKRAINVAVLSLLVSTALGMLSLLVAHHDSKPLAIPSADATGKKNTPRQPEMPQIVLPMPKPISTNLIHTNARKN